MSGKAPDVERDRVEILKVINRQVVASHNLNLDPRNFVINQNSLCDALMTLVATVRREEREAAFREAIAIVSAQSWATSTGAEIVRDAVKALERAATDKEKEDAKLPS